MFENSDVQALLPQFESYAQRSQPLASKGRAAPLNELIQSMGYSFGNGGKRFRPILSLLTAQTLNCRIENALPVAYAVECIHTYSLIHDDLPCMDDDDERRGKPTNHKVYGEAIALLAGDGLLTEAFQHLAQSYREKPRVATESVRLISEAAGWNGMVGGQSVDIANSDDIKKQWIDFIHENKTGALIRVSVEAAAVACEASASQQLSLRKFGAQLGYCFQLADDILDWDPDHPESTSYTTVYGLEATREKLNRTTEECLQTLKGVDLTTHFFEPIVRFNQVRNK